MTQYLFLFTIGPVQSFIAQVRKTQDLYAGSFLLSHLIDSAMGELAKKEGNCKFIFPDENIEHKPNRFIAEIESENIETIGRNLENHVKEEFQRIANDILQKLNLAMPPNFDNQIKTHLQVNWVAIPLKEDHYVDTYRELENYLGAIKTVRTFQQLEERGRKCSLCGERNVLFYRRTDEEEKGGLKLRKEGLLNKLYVKEEDIEIFKAAEKGNELKIQKGEGLCAVCFSKRFADRYFEENSNYTKHFPSTAGIATMDWLTNIPDDAKREYKEYFNNSDEQLYYEENLREEYLEKYDHFKGETSLFNAKEQLKRFYKLKDGNDVAIGKPPTYYALVMLDGDNMGKWLSGEFLEDYEKKNLKDFHKKLTKKLGDYADKAEEIIQNPKGRLVYAGGDDVLTFVNLNHLFDVLIELREKFPKFEELGFAIKENHKSAASAGIAIAHYKTPLSEVLKWARRMKHEAKENGGRDAFAMAVLKRSGEIRKVVFKWQCDDSSTIEILEDFIKSLKPDRHTKQMNFSSTFIRNLGVEFRRLMDEKGKYEHRDIVKTEMRRLIERSCMMTRRENETKEAFLQRKKKTINDLTGKLDILYANSKSGDNFLSSLDIAYFIERGGR